MNINTLKTALCTFLGALGGFIVELFGGWSSSMTTLVIFMAIDFITGLFDAAFFKSSTKSQSGGLNSKAGFRGLCKKATMLLIVILAYRMDLELGFTYLKNTACIGFIFNEAISITENVGLMGIPLPTVLKNAIDLLNDKGEDK